ncbi:MAG: MotA/TolQ/ExbB proton channel family protein [Planctomycetes bacterium]|nr:MotA/TolQ/ExbB proton channel family protein [Planctomycetota bacterium]
MTQVQGRPRSPSASTQKPLLRFASVDPEARLSLPCGTYTTPSLSSTLLGSIAMMLVVYTPAFLFRGTEAGALVWKYLTAFERVPILIMFLSTWSVSILVLKALKIAAQRKAFQIHFAPDDPEWSIARTNAMQVVEAIESKVQGVESFMYLNRVTGVLRTIRNVGRVGDIDEMLQSRADNDELQIDGGYVVVKGFIWAIPVLGFIGTVAGLTQAIGKFGGVLSNKDSDLRAITGQLTQVIGGLDTAFVTTGESLLAALTIHLFLTFLRRADDRFMDDCRDQCARHVTARVRVSEGDR